MRHLLPVVLMVLWLSPHEGDRVTAPFLAALTAPDAIKLEVRDVRQPRRDLGPCVLLSGSMWQCALTPSNGRRTLQATAIDAQGAVATARLRVRVR